jgi:hypothetical protein
LFAGARAAASGSAAASSWSARCVAIAVFAAVRSAAIALIAVTVIAPTIAPALADPPARPRPPEGTEILGFENLEGVMIVSSTLRSTSGADTTVRLVLDTGAGYLAIDRRLAIALGIADSTTLLVGQGETEGIGFASRALPRIRIESLEMDQVSPVLVFDPKVIREVTDRPVDGLIGQSIFEGRALQVDYRTRTLAIIPVPPPPPPKDGRRDDGAGSRGDERVASRRDSIAAAAAVGDAVARSRAALLGVMAASAVPLAFELAGDGKILVKARVSDAQPPRFSEWLTLVLDTGATKCVLFTDALRDLAPRSSRWRSLNGLAAPTLLGTAQARIVLVPLFEVADDRTSVSRLNVDAAVMRSELSDLLSRAVEQPVHGLLGYSFLRHYRITIDYPNRVVWLEPQSEHWNERPYEYSNIGIQLARTRGAVRVLAVVEGSPAARAGIAVGDVLRSIDGQAVGDVAEASRALEGAPGTPVRLVLRRGERERSYRLVRRWLM